MSDKAKGRVWEIDLPHNEKWVLLAMADHADHEGRNMYPGHALIAYKTDYSEDHVIRLVHNLMRRGILHLDDPARRPSPSNTYHIDWSACTFKPKYERAQRGRPTKSTDMLTAGSPPPQRTDNSSAHSQKSTGTSPSNIRHFAPNDPASGGNHPASSPLPTSEGASLTIEPLVNPEEPRAPRSNILPLPIKVEYDPTQAFPCAHPGCGVMLFPPTSFHGYCRDHRRNPKLTAMYPRPVK